MANISGDCVIPHGWEIVSSPSRSGLPPSLLSNQFVSAVRILKFSTLYECPWHSNNNNSNSNNNNNNNDDNINNNTNNNNNNNNNNNITIFPEVEVINGIYKYSTERRNEYFSLPYTKPVNSVFRAL